MNPHSAESDYRWLVSPEAAKWFGEISEQFPSDADTLRIANFLRRDLPPERARLIVEQLELRRRAIVKFSQADRMLFTRIGLEQATDQWVAGYKSQRYPPDAPIADLCCGIGGDLLALAQRGPATAVDRDPISLIFAEANCTAAIPVASGHVVQFSQTEVSPSALKEVQAWHIDPDRRPSGKRTTRVELHEPGPAVLAELLAACPNAAIKLAPAAEFDEPWWQDAELEWISRARECRQLVAWFGGLAAHPGRRRATALRSANQSAVSSAGETANSTTAHSFVGQPDLDPETSPQVKRFVYEPDPAVLAAKLEGDFARQHRLSALAFGVAYFTSDELVANPLVACFEVLDVLPYRTKQLRQWLAARNIGQLEIKKRGVPIDPETARRELKVAGDESATLLLCRIAGQVTAILACRLLA